MAGFRKKILWVDDEIEMLRAHIMFLETRGYSVVPVFSGEDALELIAANPHEFDIVLLDEQMPGKDGLSTLEEIKELRNDLPVVMVTKSEAEHVMEQAIGKKIDLYLTKPVNPSQILLVCKRLLDSKQLIASEVKQRFLRSYSEKAGILRGNHESIQWLKIYESLVRWDLELDAINDEGLRQIHAGQKSDFNTAFSDYIANHYGRWIKGEAYPPLLSVDVLDAVITPLVKEYDKTVFIVLSGMRLDHYFGIEEILRGMFSIERHYYYSILPSSPQYTRNSLLSGDYPVDIAKEFPSLYVTGTDPQDVANSLEQELLERYLRKAGLSAADSFWYTRMENPETFLAELKNHDKTRLLTMVIDFYAAFISGTPGSPASRQVTADERMVRSIALSWFKHSMLFQVITALAKQQCRIVITSDHGTVLCTRRTEVYGIKGSTENNRFNFGKEISADDRHVLLLDDPLHFKLPSLKNFPQCVIARENYYCEKSGNFKEYHKESRNALYQGGISMEEMIMPIAVCTPR